MSVERFVYVLEKYEFYDGAHIFMISEDYEKALAEFEKLEKEQGYGYLIKKYPLNEFDDNTTLGKTVKHIEIDYAGNVREWNGDIWEVRK